MWRCCSHFIKFYIRYLPHESIIPSYFVAVLVTFLSKTDFTTFRRFSQWRNPRAHDIARISCTFVIILFASSFDQEKRSGSDRGRATATRVSLARVVYRWIILIAELSNGDFYSGVFIIFVQNRARGRTHTWPGLVFGFSRPLAAVRSEVNHRGCRWLVYLRVQKCVYSGSARHVRYLAPMTPPLER